MEAVTKFFEDILGQLSGADFALLAIIDFAAFGAIFLGALGCCLFSEKLRAHCKRPFMYVVNAFTALTLAVFLTRFTPAQSIACAALFWCLGYALYGVLKLFRAKGGALQSVPAPSPAVSAQSVRPARPQTAPAPPPAAPAVSGVRLEHALSIADKLLLKNLGRGDRQELEKIKTALTVLKVKGVLTPQDGGALNDMFNALLKFMAKYDL